MGEILAGNNDIKIETSESRLIKLEEQLIATRNNKHILKLTRLV